MNYITVPLVIEDEDRKVIKETYMVLGIQKKEDSRYVHALIPEGNFSIDITSKLWLGMRTFDDEKINWDQVLEYLLPGPELADAEETDGFSEELQELQLTGKLKMYRSSYTDGELNEEFEFVDESLNMTVKTREVLSRTYGQFNIPSVLLSVDFFDVLKQVIDHKDQVMKMATASARDLNACTRSVEEYENKVPELQTNYESIIKDMSHRFSVILKSKKTRIAQLEDHHSLEGLNKNYVESERLDRRKINLDEIPDEPLPKKRKTRHKREPTPEPAPEPAPAPAQDGTDDDVDLSQDSEVENSLTDYSSSE